MIDPLKAVMLERIEEMFGLLMGEGDAIVAAASGLFEDETEELAKQLKSSLVRRFKSFKTSHKEGSGDAVADGTADVEHGPLVAADDSPEGTVVSSNMVSGEVVSTASAASAAQDNCSASSSAVHVYSGGGRCQHMYTTEEEAEKAEEVAEPVLPYRLPTDPDQIPILPYRPRP